MVLLSFFEISSGFWSTKKLICLGLQVSPRTLWSILPFSIIQTTENHVEWVESMRNADNEIYHTHASGMVKIKNGSAKFFMPFYLKELNE